MNEPQTFRSAFNGFHREDVVNHIAYMTNKHESLVKDLRAENENLRAELAELRRRMAADTAAQDRTAELEEKLSRRTAELESVRSGLQTELTDAKEELEAANRLLEEQSAQITALREELEEAKEAAAKAPKLEKSASHWDELRAYRRAETAERQAKERVNDLYDCANNALRSAGTTLGTTNRAFETLAEKFRADLVSLMEAIETGRDALHAAADTIDGLRPEETE